MEKNLFIFNFNRIPKGFLTLFAMVFVFEMGNAALDDFFYSPPFYGLRINTLNEYTASPGREYDILIFGDSYNARGIIPEIIEKETGLSCYNLSSYHRESMLAPYCFLKNYLKSRETPPRYIIMGYILKTCALPKEEVEIPFLYDFKDGNLGVFVKEFGPAAVLQFLIPSLKHQYFFRTVLTDPKSVRVSARHDKKEIISKIHDGNGYYLYKGYATYHEKAKDNWNGSDFKATAFFDKYLRAMLDMARERGVTVIYSIPTRPPDWYELDEKYGAMEKYREYLSDLKKEYPNMIIIDPQLSINEEDEYENIWHVNLKGAEVLSGILADRIKTDKAAGVDDKYGSSERNERVAAYRSQI